jgi:carboxymethylenebutenolidase
MPATDVLVPTPDGTCPASLHLPAGGGPWAAVVMYPDAGGLRPTLRAMGERLASLGYVVAVPDVYYRHGSWEPFSMATVFGDAAERERLLAMYGSLTAEMAVRDAEALVDFLAARPEVRPGPVGTTGYCMGGRLSLVVAGRLGDRVGAAASFHGGRLAVEEDPDSPHHHASGIRAVVYVAAARDDASFPPAQHDRLVAALDAAGVFHTVETYPALHGFAVPDNPTFDEAAAERHWTALESLFGSALGG